MNNITLIVLTAITKLHRKYPTKLTQMVFDSLLARQMKVRKNKGIKEIQSGIGGVWYDN